MRQHFAQIALLSLLAFVCFFPAKIIAQKAQEPKVLTSTVLLNSKSAPDTKTVLAALKSTWKLRTDSATTGDKTLVFNSTGGATVMVAYLDYPAAADEVGAAARLSWLWTSAQAETAKHQAQIVVSVIGSAGHTLDLYKLLTQTSAAVLEKSQASVGILLGSQYLLLSKDYFLSAARNMVQNQTVPLYCWVYFGRPGEGGGFTYGMQEFGLPEMEISNSKRPEAEIHATLYDAAMTIVKYGTRLQDGQSVTTEEGAKIAVHLVQGTHLKEQKILKLEY